MALRIRRLRNGDSATDGIGTDGSQAILTMKRDDVRTIKLDLAEFITGAETISTATTSGSLTVSTPTISSAVITFNITGPSGSKYADIKATLSTGEIITQRIHAQESAPTMSRDYAA